MRKVFALACIATIAGCSLFGFDGFSGGEEGTDGGASGDASSESPPNDGAPNVDAESDGGPSGPFCKTVGANAALCDDFEEPGTFTGKWPEQDKYLGTLEVKDAIGFAGTRGLDFTATPIPQTNDARTLLGFETPAIAKFIDAEVAVKIGAYPPAGYLGGPLYLQMDEINGGGYAIFGFEVDGARSLSTKPVVFPADAATFSLGQTAIGTLPIGVWTRLRMVVDLEKSPPALFAYLDGVLKHEQSISGFEPAKIAVRIGAMFAGTADGGTFGITFDDAKITWR